jgi:hypothetical protein
MLYSLALFNNKSFTISLMNPITDYLQSVVTNKVVLPVFNQQIAKAELAEFITAKITRQKFHP